MDDMVVAMLLKIIHNLEHNFTEVKMVRCFFNINGWQIIVMTNELVNYYNSDSSGLQDPATLSFFCLILNVICKISAIGDWKNFWTCKALLNARRALNVALLQLNSRSELNACSALNCASASSLNLSQPFSTFLNRPKGSVSWPKSSILPRFAHFFPVNPFYFIKN